MSENEATTDSTLARSSANIGRVLIESQRLPCLDVIPMTNPVQALPRIRRLAPKAHLCVYGLYAPMNEALLRDSVVVFDGELDSLKRFKDDVREVEEGFECGILLEGFNDVKEGDILEAYETREIERTTLDQPPAPAVSSS